MRKQERKNVYVYVGVIDLEKAYDRVNREAFCIYLSISIYIHDIFKFYLFIYYSWFYLHFTHNVICLIISQTAPLVIREEQHLVGTDRDRFNV